MLMIINLLRECISQAGEAPHVYAHCEVLAFHIRRADMLHFRSADTRDLFGALPLRRAVTFFAFRIVAVDFHELREVDLLTERIRHGSQVHLMAVRGQLDAIRQVARNILKEIRCSPGVPPSYQPRDYQLRLRFDGHKRPDIATDTGFHLFDGHLLLLAANEAPNFVALNALSGNVLDNAVLIVGAGFPDFRQQPQLWFPWQLP
jgi:hypothetical protein